MTQHIDPRTLSVAQHGTGFVGSAVLRALKTVSPAMPLIGIDLDEEKVTALFNDHRIPACRPDEHGKYRHFPVHSFSLPTPAAEPGSRWERWGYDLTILEKGLADFARNVLKKRDEYTLVIIRSTLYPGSTEELLIPLLERESERRCGTHFDVAYNPEFLAQETAYEDALHPPLIAVATTSDRAFEVFRHCFAGFDVAFERLPNIRVAEWVKLENNDFNAMVISAGNEMRNWMLNDGVSYDDACAAVKLLSKTAFAKTKESYGLNPMGPWGGACLPKETTATLQANSHRGYPSLMLEAAMRVNEHVATQSNNESVRIAAE